MVIPVEEEKIKTIPPPEPTEYFPGFGVEFQQLGIEVAKAQKRVVAAVQAKAKAVQAATVHQTLSSIWGFRSPEGFIAPAIGGLMRQEDADRMLAEAAQEQDLAAQQLESAIWRGQMMAQLPGYVSNPFFKVQTIEDVFALTDAEGNPLVHPDPMTDADTQWLTNLLNRLEPISNTLPDDFLGDAMEAQRKVLEEILTAPKLELRGVHHLTIEEIAKSFAFPVAAMPPNVTEEDVRHILSQWNLTEEVLKDERAWLSDRAKEWAIESARLRLLRAGAVAPEIPELSMKEFGLLVLTQPMMATAELVDKYFNILARPLSAWARVNLPAPVAGAAHGIIPGAVTGATSALLLSIFGGPIGIGAWTLIGIGAGILGYGTMFTLTGNKGAEDISELYQFNKQLGFTDWEAYANAFNDWEAPWYLKLPLELSFDPTMAIGFGWVTAASFKLGQGLTRIGLRGLGSRIGPFTRFWEYGYMAGADAVFKTGLRGIALPFKGFFWSTEALARSFGIHGAVQFAIPKTASEMALRFQQNGVMKFFGMSGRLHPKARTIKGLTAKDAIDDGVNAINQFLARPKEGHDTAVQIGADLMERNAIDDVAARKLFRGVSKEFDDIPTTGAVGEGKLDTATLAHIEEQILDMFSGQGERITAGMIHANLGIEATEESLSKLAAKLVKLKDNAANAAKAALKGDNWNEVVMSAYNRVGEIRKNNILSPLTVHMVQSGRAASFYTKIAERILRAPNLISTERKVVMPLARWNLLFANFGPYNFGETGMRSWLGGGELLFPKSYNVAYTQDILGDLSNYPYHLRMMAEGETHLAQAMIDPGTGKTAIFKGGNVPDFELFDLSTWRIPFVTERVTIPGKIPFFGGKTIGKKFNSGGRDFYIGMLQDHYDMFAYFNYVQEDFFYRGTFFKAMREMYPNEMGMIDEVADRHLAKLKNIGYLDKIDVNDIDGLIRQLSVRGSEAVRRHSKIDVLEMERRLISKDISKVMSNATEVRGMTKKSITDDVLDGSMFDGGVEGITAKMSSKLEQERELSLLSLKNQIDALTSRVDDMIAHLPRNLKDFMGDLNEATIMMDANMETIKYYRSLATIRKKKLLPAEMDNFEVGSAKLLAEYMDTGEEQLVKVLNHLRAKIKAAGLNDIQLARFNDLDEIMRLSLESKLSVRHKLAEHDAIIARTKKRTNRFWTQHNAKKAEIWDEYDKEALRYFEMELDARANFLSSVDDTIEWQPVMNPSDAAKWSSGSSTSGTFFHGTSVDIDRNIRAVGVYPSEEGIFGRGVYLTKTREHAMFYAGKGGKTVPIVANTRNAYKVDVTDPDSLRKFLADIDESFGEGLGDIERWITNAGDRIRAKGYDALEVTADFRKVLGQVKHLADKDNTVDNLVDTVTENLGTPHQLVVFEPNNVAVVSGEASATKTISAKVYTPDFIPEVIGDLTPNHLAYLYGVTGDDLYRGLTKVHHHITIRPKDEFVAYTTRAAKDYARKFGKTADDIGFTKDAIGDVYDQMWRSQGIEPTILTPDSPTAMQLDEIKDSLIRLYQARKIPESDVVKYRQYINSVADDLEKLPMYQKVAPFKTAEEAVASGQYLVRGKAAIPTGKRAVVERDVPGGVGGTWATDDVDYALKYGEPLSFIPTPKNILSSNDFNRITGATLEKVPWSDMKSLAQQHGFDAIRFEPGAISSKTEIWIFERAKLSRLSELGIPKRMGARIIEPRAAEEGIFGKGNPFTADTMNSIDTLTFEIAGRKEIEEAIGQWAISENRLALNNLIQAVKKDAKYLSELHSILKKQYGNRITVYRGARKEATGYVSVTTKKNVAEEFASRHKGKVTQYDVPTNDVIAAANTYEHELIVDSSHLTVAKPEAKVAPTASSDWIANKEAAMAATREQHALSFPTYDSANIIEEGLRKIYPFINYELFRLRWIPRTFLRTPGTMTGLARYMDYTDQGYISIPGTDLQMNILRGTIWLGGLRQLYLRDFPEYQDVFPGMEAIDYFMRLGFFPNNVIMTGINLWGASRGRPETAEVLPVWMRTGLSALRVLSPEHVGNVLEIIYPDRFRDYMVMLKMASDGYVADELWRKKAKGELTPEEEKLWLQYANKVDGLQGILMQQTGLFRLRPEEFTIAKNELKLAIEESTGVSVRIQDQISQRYHVTGKRLADYYPLDILQSKLVYEHETLRRYQGMMTPLYPAGLQPIFIKTRDYYEEVEKLYEDARKKGFYTPDGKLDKPSIEEATRQWVAGEIGPKQWIQLRSDIQGGLSEAVRILGESPAYKGVPKTLEERTAMLALLDLPAPTQTPDQELLQYYFELKPEYKWDWEAQRKERDFETYYAHIDILLESLDDAHRERFLQRIQYDWTPMERLYWQVSREYLRPYRNIREIVLATYEPEQVQQIRRFEVARGTERDDLLLIVGPEGDKLIAGFNSRVREAGQRLRILDPQIDAWLSFWGRTDKLLTAQAKEIYAGLEKQYLTPAMIKNE